MISARSASALQSLQTTSDCDRRVGGGGGGEGAGAGVRLFVHARSRARSRPRRPPSLNVFGFIQSLYTTTTTTTTFRLLRPYDELDDDSSGRKYTSVNDVTPTTNWGAKHDDELVWRARREQMDETDAPFSGPSPTSCALPDPWISSPRRPRAVHGWPHQRHRTSAGTARSPWR